MFTSSHHVVPGLGENMLPHFAKRKVRSKQSGVTLKQSRLALISFWVSMSGHKEPQKKREKRSLPEKENRNVMSFPTSVAPKTAQEVRHHCELCSQVDAPVKKGAYSVHIISPILILCPCIFYVCLDVAYAISLKVNGDRSNMSSILCTSLPWKRWSKNQHSQGFISRRSQNSCRKHLSQSLGTVSLGYILQEVL